MAILKVSDSNIKMLTIPYAVKQRSANIGEHIFVLGYPLTETMGNSIKMTDGIISSDRGFKDDVSLYQISAPVQPGNSGGPLFDSNGNIIGIINSKHTGAENVGYAIKISYLYELMNNSGLSSYIPQNNTISSLPMPQNLFGLSYYILQNTHYQINKQ